MRFQNYIYGIKNNYFSTKNAPLKIILNGAFKIILIMYLSSEKTAGGYN